MQVSPYSLAVNRGAACGDERLSCCNDEEQALYSVITRETDRRRCSKHCM